MIKKLITNPFLLALLYVILLVKGVNPWLVVILVVAFGILRANRMGAAEKP
jgi:accessory gene regulator protein AgrB